MGKIRNKEHKMRNKEVLTPYKWKKLLQSQAFQLSYSLFLILTVTQ